MYLYSDFLTLLLSVLIAFYLKPVSKHKNYDYHSIELFLSNGNRKAFIFLCKFYVLRLIATTVSCNQILIATAATRLPTSKSVNVTVWIKNRIKLIATKLHSCPIDLSVKLISDIRTAQHVFCRVSLQYEFPF